MNASYNKLIMYYEIHKMDRAGYSASKISRKLLMNRRTVMSYLAMSVSEYELFIQNQSERPKELQPFEEFVKNRLEKYQDTSASQMHDWLKEWHEGFPKVSQKTVYNFVMWVRQKYNLPKISPTREYMIVEELPYGQQAQVDFGEYNMRDGNGKRVKVRFFLMVLSRSRFKYVWFIDQPFTSDLAIAAHEKAFESFGGIPDEIVYDQDTVFIVDENKGDLILTHAFRAYTKERSFTLHFCRKADPESKGKVENGVKYVKQNFLYNRPYYNIETLNEEAIAWLGRTANIMPHGRTMKPPYDEWVIEKPFLKHYTAFMIQPSQTPYTVRKDNSISWKGNFYTLPKGTYKGRGSQVCVKEENDAILISDLLGNMLGQHPISCGRGQVIVNTDHRRDKIGAITELIEQVSLMFEDPLQAKQYLETIQGEKPRYIRDQITLIRQTVEKHDDKQIVNQALAYCCRNSIYSAVDFKAVVEQNTRSKAPQEEPVIPRVNPLSGLLSQKTTLKPTTSKITDYQILMQKKANDGKETID